MGSGSSTRPPITLYFSYAIPLQNPPEYPAPSLPLDRARWLARDIIGHPIDSAHFIDDAGGGPRQKFGVERIDIGRHAIRGCNRPQSTGVIVGAAIPHHANR